MNLINHFFEMGGYGIYVFPAYGLVLTLLGIQWFSAWRRWHRFSQQITKNA